MSDTIFRIQRTGRPNVPNIGTGTDNAVDWGILAGVFGVGAPVPTVAATIGYLEIRDARNGSVETSDG